MLFLLKLAGVLKYVRFCFFPAIVPDVCVADNFATLDTMHALCLPLGASISLLVMFFFFDSMQMLFAVATAGKKSHNSNVLYWIGGNVLSYC